MSIRTWQAEPSATIELDGVVYPVVTQNDLAKAIVDGAVLVDRAGGCLYVAASRIPTGLPNAYVTTAALVTWSDRTAAKPQPEKDARGDAPAAADLQEASPEGRLLSKAEAPLFDDGLHVDPAAVDENDEELRAVVGG